MLDVGTAGGAGRRSFYQDHYTQSRTPLLGCLKTHKSMKKDIEIQSEPTHTTGPDWNSIPEGTRREAAQAGKCDLLVLRLPEGWVPFTA